MRKKPASETVGFRANAELLKLIDRERERFGVSRGEWVRGVISAQLFKESQENNAARLEELQNLVKESCQAIKLHDRKLAAALFTVLTEVGEMEAGEAKALVRRRIIEQGGSR